MKNLQKRATIAVRNLRALEVREARIVLPSEAADELLKEGSSYLGMIIISSDSLPPMVLTEDHFGRFVLIPKHDERTEK